MVITNLRKYHQLINRIFPNLKPSTLNSKTLNFAFSFQTNYAIQIHSELSLKEQDELWEKAKRSL